MTSKSFGGKVRFVEALTPPFQARVIITAQANTDPIWAQARAEAMLMEQIRAQVGGRVGNLAILRKMGVYTVRYDSDQRWYIHDVDAPNGIKYMAVEEVPRWWEAEDTIPMDRVPNGPALMIALLPTLSLDAWRKNSWPDRPHP